MVDYLLNAFATLLVTIDPIGLAPIFLAITRGASAEMRRAIAVRGSIIAAVILVAFALTGTVVLTFLGISLPAFGSRRTAPVLDRLRDGVREAREAQTGDGGPGAPCRQSRCHRAPAGGTAPHRGLPAGDPAYRGPGAISATS